MSGGWYTAAPCPVQRRYPTLIRLNNGKVLLLPATTYGYDSSPAPTVTAACYLFTPGGTNRSVGSWAATGSLITPRASFNRFVKLADGRVLAIGGTIDNVETRTANCEIYDPNTETWSAVAPLPEAKCLVAATLLQDGTVLATCGSTAGTSKKTHIYNPGANTWTEVGSIAQARLYAPVMRLTDGRVLIIGGQVGGGSAEVYDPNTQTWSAAPAPPVGINVGYATELDDGSFLVTGGSPAFRVYLSSGNITYSNAPATPTGKITDGAVGTNTPILAGGVNTSPSVAVSATTIKYVRASNTWDTTLGNMAAPRNRHGIVGLGSFSLELAVGGATTGDVLVSTAEIFDPNMIAATLTSPSTASATVGVPFSFTVTGANGPTSYSAASLPAGLSIDTTTGVISGTPSTPGVANATQTVLNGAGGQTGALTITVLAPAPVITSSLTASGKQGVAFSYTITASNTPTSYAATGLPTGLSVNTGTGAITGTPTVNGSFNVTISATNSGGTDSETLVLTLASSVPAITSSLSASATQGSAFSYSITATESPTSYGATGLPAGVTVNTSTGLLSGTPSVSGSFNVSISATNTFGTDTKTLVLSVASGVPSITSSLAVSAGQGNAFSYTITATQSPTSFGATGLPSGLSVNTSSGLISGTPTVSGTFNVSISATNAYGTDTKTLVLTLSSSVPSITSSLSASGTAGVAFSYSITATNTPTSFGATGLPSGLSVNTGTGAITGTPSVSGPFNVTISATNAFGTDSQTLVITLAIAAPSVTSSGSASAVQGQPFSYTITASNSPTSFGATGLPSGLSVNTGSGVISGTPTGFGAFAATISATNVTGTGTKTLNIAVAAAPVITSPPTASVIAGDPFSYTVTATNSPITFAASGLPAGLSINPTTGVISGSTLLDGVYSVGLSATNAAGGVGTATLSLSVVLSPPVITSSLTASETQYTPFSYTITASNNPSYFDATGLPPGMSVDHVTGVISGPTLYHGSWSVQITATNAAGSDTQTLALTIAQYFPPPPVITSSLSANALTGVSFTYTITASGSPTSFGATGLPSGVSVNTGNGVISGVPTLAGLFLVSISATNAGGTDTESLVLSVTTPPPKSIVGNGAVVSRRAVLVGTAILIRAGQAATAERDEPLDESKSGGVYPVNSPRSVFGGA